MDISQITPPAIRGTGLVAPIATTQAAAVEQAQAPALPAVAPTTVDLSSSGRFLSLASLFQKKALELQTSVRADADTSTALADVAVSATAVADAFTQLQTSAVDSNGLPADTLDGQSLQSQFFQQLSDTPEEAEASLAAIGLGFTPAAGASVLAVDETVLEDAFRQDPGATAALLERAAGAFLSVVGTQIQAQVPDPAIVDDESVFGVAQPAPVVTPEERAAAPTTPDAEQASYANNIFLQSLVTENLRNEGARPAGRTGEPAPSLAVDAGTDGNAISVAQQARVLAQQLQAEREAARELDQKIAGASDAVRAALAEQIARRDASRVDQLDVESTRIQRRADQSAPASAASIAADQFARPDGATLTPATALPPTDTSYVDQDLTPQPPAVPPPEQAQQAARDPAIAAAIAAYHISTGPFAAQNGRPEIPPPKARPVAPVAAVTKVQPAEAAGTPGDGSAPLR